MYKERREQLKDTLSTGADFIPVIGDIKSYAEAESALDYLAATIGVVPGVGDAAGKAIKAAETALKKGNLAEASRLINETSQYVASGAKGAGTGKAPYTSTVSTDAEAGMPHPEKDAGVKGGAVRSGAENGALYPKLKDQLIQESLSNIAAQDSRLAVAVNGNGTKDLNFSIGQGTSSEANQLGKTWVGDGATKTSDGLGLISADGTRVYRPPTPKNSSFATTGVQANFEMYSINPVTGQRVKVSNGHLDVAD
ncbi:hypothetical protein ACJA3S_05650 [Pseudomonas sp. KnCO4]|uniref:hypothetical protein n=1 Tax=Pseudomonas sp. KnCO4 TaxID=3381355 RepID=UPI003877D272